jgi:hypothetical protein
MVDRSFIVPIHLFKAFELRSYRVPRIQELVGTRHVVTVRETPGTHLHNLLGHCLALDNGEVAAAFGEALGDEELNRDLLLEDEEGVGAGAGQLLSHSIVYDWFNG